MADPQPGQRPRSPRTQGERSAATRARILAAVVASIDAVGLARTTAQRIAREAGVSVGAVQHHFPARSDLLAAVLERSAQNLAAQFEGLDLAGLDLATRIDRFVDRAWRHYGSAAFRSTLVILSDAAPASASDPHSTTAVHGSARRAALVWNALFGDLELTALQQRAVRNYAFASLAGLAIANRLQPSAAAVRVQTGMLKVALAAVFAEAGGRAG